MFSLEIYTGWSNKKVMIESVALTNSLIDFFTLFFLPTNLKTNMFLKFIEKKLQWNEFCEISASVITERERLEAQKGVSCAATWVL